MNVKGRITYMKDNFRSVCENGRTKWYIRTSKYILRNHINRKLQKFVRADPLYFADHKTEHIIPRRMILHRGDQTIYDITYSGHRWLHTKEKPIHIVKTTKSLPILLWSLYKRNKEYNLTIEMTDDEDNYKK